MDTEALNAFIEVANKNSFSAAARSLQISPTQISDKVRKLEEVLGVRLFDRTTRAVNLTEVGQQCYDKAAEILTCTNELVSLTASQAQEPQGKLRITAASTFASHVLGDWLIEFQLLYPKVETELIASNLYLDLQEHHLDFGFRQGPLPNSGLIARKIVEYRFGLYVAPQFLSSVPTPEHPEDLKKMRCVTIGNAEDSQLWEFERAGQQCQFHPNHVMKMEDPDLVRRAAVAGIGIIYIAEELITEDVENGLLVPLLEEWWPPPVTLHVVYTSNKHMAAKNRCFVDFILERSSFRD